ncbi:MAG: carboxypeptidase-like regulatory domain-containing protein, partial [Candidatus Latescibacterota bacterium]
MGINDFCSVLIRKIFPAACLLAVVAIPYHNGAAADATLHGTVFDAETKEPIEFVTIILNSSVIRVSAEDGSFDFGNILHGRHVLSFEHISYERRIVRVQWPSDAMPLTVALEPSPFTVDEIVVKGERALPSLPVSAVSFTRKELAAAVGNIANDPLRTVQSQPSCAAGGMDFLSQMAIRGGDSEEHRVYFDGYPLTHHAHVGGFSGLVYDDMLESTVLVPGTVPIRYKGSLSGIVLLQPARADTSFRSFRFDITSMAGGLSHIVNPALSLQVSAKKSFFNLPVYQQATVRDRSFKDVLGRIRFALHDKITMTATVLMATDNESGYTIDGIQPERGVSSILAGLQVVYRPARWEITLRPSYSRYDSRDAISWRRDERTHTLDETHL